MSAQITTWPRSARDYAWKFALQSVWAVYRLAWSHSKMALDVTRTPEGVAYTLWVVGKDIFARPRLALDDLPRLRRVLEPLVVSLFLLRMLRIAHEAGPVNRVVIAPFNSADFGFPPGREDRKLENVAHRNNRAAIAARKKGVEPCELVRGWAPIALLRFCDEPQ